MRDLKQVVIDIIKFVPVEQEGLLSQLRDNLSSIEFASPELIPMWWNEVHSTLIENMDFDNLSDWELNILSVFSTKTISELKSALVKNK